LKHKGRALIAFHRLLVVLELVQKKPSFNCLPAALASIAYPYPLLGNCAFLYCFRQDKTTCGAERTAKEVRVGRDE
jgi:hypothetical protein